MTPEQRYQRDPLFHAMVQAMLAHLRNASMTATEIREAAILAAQIHEYSCAKSFFIPDSTRPMDGWVSTLAREVDPGIERLPPEFKQQILASIKADSSREGGGT